MSSFDIATLAHLCWAKLACNVECVTGSTYTGTIYMHVPGTKVNYKNGLIDTFHNNNCWRAAFCLGSGITHRFPENWSDWMRLQITYKNKHLFILIVFYDGTGIRWQENLSLCAST